MPAARFLPPEFALRSLALHVPRQPRRRPRVPPWAAAGMHHLCDSTGFQGLPLRNEDQQKGFDDINLDQAGLTSGSSRLRLKLSQLV